MRINNITVDRPPNERKTPSRIGSCDYQTPLRGDYLFWFFLPFCVIGERKLMLHVNCLENISGLIEWEKRMRVRVDVDVDSHIQHVFAYQYDKFEV